MEDLILILILISAVFYLLSLVFRHRFFSFMGQTFLISGLLGELYLISGHFFQTQRLPLTNTSETLLSLIALIILVYLILEYKVRLPKVTGALVSLVSLLGLYAAFHIFKKPIMPLLPALQSRLLVFHVSSCIAAYGFFTIAFISALVYLFKGQGDVRIFPVMHRSIAIGFYLLTVGIILGSLWGKSAWGHWWNWDPKETWALITWLIYASYIHGRLFGNWSEKKLCWIAIAGFLACLFTYLGVNFLLKGLHSYA